ncbi:beta-lactamase [Fusarium phyllophilum]|uniref:Beta-lactamase n=1 Tax=Fusarium phyllophilum TaxID=47803 RepID=A0A8H5IVW8_9HYPO|nr:beta-lactamase [Fusarium phyllophilum]
MSVLSQDVQSKLRGIIDEYTIGGTESKIPGLVYSAFRNDGEPIFQHYSGLRGVTSESPMSEETIFFMASFTKLATSVACMQLVEQGKLRLDDADQVEAICPELRDVKVVTRNKDGKLELVEKVRRITLRMLLTHMAGFGYAFEDEKLAEFSRPIGFDDFSGEAIDTANRPLVNQPGEAFQYGVSMDWVGVIIERTYKSSLEEVFREHIFQPLGMNHVTFHPSAEDKANLAYMHRRSPSGKLSTTDHFYRRPLLAQDGEKVPCAGGHGCFGRPAEFGRIISLLLNDGLDAKSGVRLLRPETVNDMFTDQIPDKPRFSNVSVPVAKPELANPTPLTPMPDDHTEGWGLSFSINHFPEPSGRAAGSASWEGLANLFWFADRKNNIGGIIASQVLPYGDTAIMADGLSVASGVLALVTFAFQSSTVLYKTVRSYKTQDANARALKNELNDLTGVLHSLLETVTNYPEISFDSLELPLLRCGKTCEEYGKLIARCTKHSNGTRPSFRDWIGQQYLKGDITDFRDMLAGTITAVTRNVIDEYKDMIDDTIADLQKHMQRLDERARSLAIPQAESVESDSTDWLALFEEKESTRKGLQICTELSLHIEALESTSSENPQFSKQPSADKYIKSSLSSAKTSISTLESRLRSHGSEIDRRMDAMKLKTDLSEDDINELAQLRETKESIHQCMNVVAHAGEDLAKERANIFEDITMADNAYGITVSTVKDLVFARRVNVQGQARYVGGQIDEASYNATISALTDLDRGSAQYGGRDMTWESSKDEVANKAAISRAFLERHGPGVKLEPPGVSAKPSGTWRTTQARFSAFTLYSSYIAKVDERYSAERDAQFNALIDILHSVKSDIFDPFTITRTYYESAGIQIGVDILIPRQLKSQNPPVIVRVHGGFLITGSSLFPAWFSKWVLGFAEEQDAVIISPNYKLLPEVKGRDILHDMGNFWNWVHSGGPSRHLAEIGQHKLQLNLIRTLVVGESAGGYLALQSVLSGFVRPKAIIALYPMVDMKAAHFTKSYTKSIVGVPNYSNEDVNKFLSATVAKPAITEADPPVRLDSAMAVVHNGRYLELLGEDPDLFILDRIKELALTSATYEKSLFPPLFLLHGEGDTAVPVDGTRKLVDCLQQFDPSTQIHLAIRPGDHGFDFKATIDEPWLKEGLDFIVSPWLDSKSLI